MIDDFGQNAAATGSRLPEPELEQGYGVQSMQFAMPKTDAAIDDLRYRGISATH